MDSCSTGQGVNGKTQAIKFSECVITRDKLMDRDFLHTMNGKRRIRRG